MLIPYFKYLNELFVLYMLLHKLFNKYTIFTLKDTK